MTLVWFIVWLIATLIGDDEVLTFAPVNVWAGALLLCVALDLGRQHAPGAVNATNTGVRRRAR